MPKSAIKAKLIIFKQTESQYFMLANYEGESNQLDRIYRKDFSVELEVEHQIFGMDDTEGKIELLTKARTEAAKKGITELNCPDLHS
jgi:hypothetical protein